MIILKEESLSEKIVSVAFKELKELSAQAETDPVLSHNLHTMIRSNKRYEFLLDSDYSMLRNATPFQIIQGCIEAPNIKTFFLKNSKGLYTGFLGVIEKSPKVIEDIKMFSFGLANNKDENLMYKDIPLFLSAICKNYKSVTWSERIGNKANTAYEIACKKLKGTIEKNGNRITYHVEK